MPGSEYTAVSGGALKLKGNAGVDKKRKKKKAPKPTENQSESSAQIQDALADEDQGLASGEPSEGKTEVVTKEVADTLASNKTEAERRYEERRRKTLEDRLKREGIKTHKERVEELNRYLSKLSEHHDM